jgi:acetolactate synthase-1/2/3 large subunit
MKGTTSDILAAYLQKESVKYLFGVPGFHVLPIYDAAYRAGIKPILSKNENGGAFFAYGYARISGNTGVCCGTVGPGATNMVTAVSAAYMDSVPLLVLTGQVTTTSFGRSCHQEATGYGRSINHLAIFKSITKMSVTIAHRDCFSHTLRTALRVAQAGRPGPVHLDIPSNIQREEIQEEIQDPAAYRPDNSENTISSRMVNEIVGLLSSAEKPAILLGRGAAECARDDKLIQFVERLQIPVATSPKAKGVFPEDHDLSLGCLSSRGSQAAKDYIRSGTDVLLVVGTDLGEFTSLGWDSCLVPGKALIQIDIDPNEIGKNYPVTIGLVADARAAVASLCDGSRDVSRVDHNDIPALKRASGYFAEKESLSDSVPLKPQRLMAGLRKHLPRNTIILGDMGNTMSWITRYFQSYPEGPNIMPTGLACMGSSVAAAAGAKLAAPDQNVVCICGDGSFLMTGLELLSAVNYSIPVVWVIVKNNRLGSIFDIENLLFEGRHSSTVFNDIDFLEVARAFNMQGFRIDAPQQISEVISQAVRCNKPAIVEAVIDPDEKFPHG